LPSRWLIARGIALSNSSHHGKTSPREMQWAKGSAGKGSKVVTNGWGSCKVSDFNYPIKGKNNNSNKISKRKQTLKKHLFRCHHDATVKVIMEITSESCI